MRLIALAFAALGLAGCAYPYPPPALAPVAAPAPSASATSVTAVQASTPVTILVSIDGFRPDYLHQGNTPTLDGLAARAVSATMRPSFPTMTFPNHYTMVTGLRPDRHGVINNTMFDPARPGVEFKTSDAKQVRDAFWWNGAEPIWVTAERAGIRTGTMYWPGSEAAIRGVRPSAWVPYAAEMDWARRVDFVIDWLRRPAAERPRLLTLYFDTVDKASHTQGFDSPEKLQAIRDSDAAIARLLAGLAALGQAANVVVVSDHGMAPVRATDTIDVQAEAADARMTILPEGPQLSIFAKPGGGAAVAAWMATPMPHATCWPRGALPERLHFGHNPRMPDWLCLAEPHWRFVGEAGRAYLKGEHGYEPTDPAMAALFIADGPAFVGGKRLATFDNIDIAPLLRDLIGLPPGRDLDGDDAPFRGVLKR